MTLRQHVFWIGLFSLLFLGALFWAKQQDPFTRNWFSLRVPGQVSLPCVTVLPKPVRACPVVVLVHGTWNSLMEDGNDLRQMAELGLATISLEYDQTNEAAFSDEFVAVLHYLDGQRWANTNAIAWVGCSLGANRIFDFARQHPERQPQLLVLASGNGLNPSSILHPPSSLFKCPVLLVHGDQDEISTMDDTQRLAAALQTNGVAAELKIIPGSTHDFEPNRKVVFRGIGEVCLSHLSGTNCWQNYHSIARWEAEAPPFWRFCLPAVFWIVGWRAWAWRRREPVEPIKLHWSEILLRVVATVLAIWAVTETGFHLITPRLPVSDRTLAIARRMLVQPKERTAFEYLAKQPVWPGVRLQTMLDHAELAVYNRELINWQLEDSMYRDYVLSPIITGKAGEDFAWRRPLWEEFYPRIRHENSPADAAQIVVRHLRERVTIATLPDPPREVPAIWLRQVTDEAGFQIIYVAALRSVGVPARLDTNGLAEFWDDNRWQTAPAPAILRW